MTRTSLFFWAVMVVAAMAQAAPLPERLRRRIPALPAAPLIDETNLMPSRLNQTGEPLDLAACYRLAFAHQPVLGSAQAKVAQAQARLNQQYALYAPSLSYTFAKTLNRGNSLTGIPLIPGQVADTSTMGFQLNQTLFDFGQRRALVDAYRESLRAALFSWQGSWVDQVQKVQQAYFEQLRAEYLVAIAVDNQTRVQSYAEISRRFYEGGIKSKIDVTQVEIQLAQAQIAMAQTQNAVRNARVNLAQALGVDVRSLERQVLRDEIFETFALPDHDQASQRLLLNPQVLALEAQVRFNAVSSDAQWKQVLPTFAGAATYGLQGVEVPPEIRIWTLGLTVNFPFFQPGIQPAAELFDATAEQFKKDRDTTLLTLQQQLDSAFADVQGAEQRTNFAAQEVAVALKNFQIAYKRYATGLSDITELINARSFLQTAQIDYVNALVDRKVAEGRLRFTQSYQPDPMVEIEGLDYEK